MRRGYIAGVDEADLIGTAAAADLLGVRVQTVYAYVSRGLLSPGHGPGGRRAGSTFRRHEVLALAERHRTHRPSGRFELAVDSDVTALISEGVLLYRGRDVSDLARSSSYEQVVQLLWQREELDWSATSGSVAAGTQAAAWEGSSMYADRVRLAVHLDHLRDPPADFIEAGRSALLAAVAALDPRAGSDRTLAERVTRGLAGSGADAPLIPIVDAAMVLLADHELATSTLAARAAAGTGAPAHLVLLAGLAALGGERHGAASVGARRLLDAAASKGAATALATTGPGPAGFGHLVYVGVDPRAETLLQLLEPSCPDVLLVVERLRVAVRRAGGGEPNVDLALAALEIGFDLPAHSGEAIFAIARMAGFVAHGMEEQGHRLRFRPRAVYTGPHPPQSTGGPM